MDGSLDEPEWAGAQILSDFLTTEPNTQATPEYLTEARIWTDAEGIHIGFINEHPALVPRQKPQTLRDQQADADSVTVLLDFEGNGKVAYEFTVSLGNSIEDAIVSDPGRFNQDWDGAWLHAVAEEPHRWTAELLIPWSVAPMAPAAEGQRKLGIFVSRQMRHAGRRWSYPAYDLERPTLVADLAPLTLQDFAASAFDLYPYVAASRDLVDDSNDARIGMDLFWKPDGLHQVSATLNPDFGQVESDDLVVNLTAIETFFSEKRPFFTENQALFDIRAPTKDLLVNTRRIGGAPDAGDAGASDILGALKYTGTTGAWDYGLFGATEDDTGDVQGRDYAVGRLRRRFEGGSFGWLGDFVNRPTLDRESQVQSVDADWSPRAGLSWRGQFIFSQARESGETVADTGGWLRFDYAPGGAWSHAISFTHYGDQFDTNDLGYLARNDLNRLDIDSSHSKYDFAPGSRLDVRTLGVLLKPARNDHGKALASNLETYIYWRLRDTSEFELAYTPTSRGVDDRITRGNNPVQLGWHHGVRVTHISRLMGRLRVTTIGRYRQEGVRGDNRSLYVAPTWYFTDRVNAEFEVLILANDAWLLWDGGNTVSDYATQWREGSMSLGAFIGSRHELRVKFQWAGIRADSTRSYEAQPGGKLVRDQDLTDDFTLSTLGIQVRYRYSLGPLSDLYAVYGRGGDIFREDDSGSFGGLLDDSLRERSAEQLLVKLRLHF
ncbi:hypothetical protein B1810_17845 [Panacagrimonas perspica]|nr:hypothetical protein B1810_17845 [Panacagrimonas perspica]